jgi:putative DNA primase/helicase
MKSDSVDRGEAQAQLSEVDRLLSFIPADERETWISVGMALKYEFGDAAFTLFDAWSRCSEKYDPRAVGNVWKSFKGAGKTLGTVRWLAKQYGPITNVINGSRTCRVGTQGTEQKHKLPTGGFVQDAADGLKRRVANAKKLFLAASNDDAHVMAHSYAISKGLESAGGAGRGKASGSQIGRDADCLIVPIRNIETNKVQGIECINAEGVKQTLGQKSGGALILGNSLQKSKPWYILEGWASTYSTVYHHNKHTAVCAFGKGSQDSVAREINRIYNPDEIIILREVD